MTHVIRLRPSGHAFGLEGRETILDAALRAGIHLDHGCASGNCGQCLARSISGTIAAIHHSDYPLSAMQKSRGYFLACVNTATSDLVLEAPEAASAAEIPVQCLRATIKRMRRLDTRYSLLRLQTPRTRVLRFLAGQRVRLTLDEGGTAELHLASCPCDGRNLDILIRHEKGREAADRVPGLATRGTFVTLEGPYGDFVLDEASRRPQLFLGVDAGLAPVLSLVEQSVAVGRARRIDLFRFDDGGSSGYVDNLCRSWQDVLDDFRCHVSNTRLSCRETAYWMEKDGRLAGADVYLAGPAEKINAIAQNITERPARLSKEYIV